MLARPITRAAAAALALALACAGIAAADTAPGDADLVTPGRQASRDLGTVGPGAVVVADVGFVLTCGGLAHVDHGQVVSFSLGAMTTIPAGGSVVTTSGAIGPIPESWPVDGIGCPYPAPTVGLAEPIRVTVTAPTIPGSYTFTLFYDRSVAPAGSGDGAAMTSMTAVDLVVTVAEAPPPAPPPPPPPPTEADASVTFLPPLAGGEMTVPWLVRSVPVKFRIDPAPASAPTLALMPLAACGGTAAAGAERPVEVRPVGKSGFWLGQASLAGLDAPCVLIEVRIDGVAIGSGLVTVRR